MTRVAEASVLRSWWRVATQKGGAPKRIQVDNGSEFMVEYANGD